MFIILYYTCIIKQENAKEIMKKFASILLGITFTMLLAPMSFAQEVSLSLSEALEIAQKETWEVKKSEQNLKAARAGYQQTNAIFLPKVQLSESGATTTDPLMAFGFRLKQKIVQNSDFNSDLLNNPDRITNFNTRFEVQQPIVNLDGYWARKAANSQVQATEMQAMRTKHYIAYEIKKAYYGLQLAKQSKAVIKTALKAAEAMYQITSDNVEQGYVKNADLMSVRVRLLELKNNLADAEHQIANGEAMLVHVLRLEPGTKLKLTDELVKPSAVEGALGTAELPTNRSDFQAMQFALTARENMLKSTKNEFLPRLNAMAAYEFNDSNLFGTNASNYFLGFNLQWTIFNGYKRLGGIQKAKAELEREQIAYEQHLSQNEVQLQKAYRGLTLAKNKLETSELAVQQAEESFRIRKNRFEEGMEKTADVLMSEAEVAKQQLNYLKNIYEYQVAQFTINFLTEE